MTDLVMVPVPANRVIDVYRFLSTPIQELPTQAQHDSSTSQGWPDDLIRRAYRESPEAMLLVFAYLSDRPDTDVTGRELAVGIGRNSDQFRGVLGAFGRRSKNRYGMDSWPFKATWDPVENQMHYEMDSHVAELIRELRGV